MQTNTSPATQIESNNRVTIHAINNQLSILFGYLQLIAQAPSNVEQVAKWNEKAIIAYHKLELLVEQLEK